MNWITLNDVSQLVELKTYSEITPQVIFKHSTRCSISNMAKNRLERSTVPQGIRFYILDLLKFRNLSNQIAQEFSIMHQSPQILVISKGVCIYQESHSGIQMDYILAKTIAA